MRGCYTNEEGPFYKDLIFLKLILRVLDSLSFRIFNEGSRSTKDFRLQNVQD